MGTGVYKTIKGQKVELTARQVKSYIMQVNNWTKEEYKKNYDIFKNKLRSYEAFTAQQGLNQVTPQSPAKVLYFEALAKKREGAKYRPSAKMERIRSFTSISSGKKLQQALTKKGYIEARNKEFTKGTLRQFGGLLANNAKAQEIYNTIKDPVKREQALIDYANMIHAKLDEQSKSTEVIPSGETYGSTDAFDFDINDYL